MASPGLSTVFGPIAGISGLFSGGGGLPDYGSNFDLGQYGYNPSASPIADFLNTYHGANIGGPTQAGPNYTAHDYTNEALPQYDALRSRLNSQYSQVQGQGQDAIDRQFAAMGGGPGNGAQLKQTENLAYGIAKQKGEDLSGINAEEAQTRTQLNQDERNKAFQSGETGRGLNFQGQESYANRSLANQENTTNTILGARNTIANLNLGWETGQAEARNNAYNAQIAQYQSKHSGGLFGSGGFMGLGI